MRLGNLVLLQRIYDALKVYDGLEDISVEYFPTILKIRITDGVWIDMYANQDGIRFDSCGNHQGWAATVQDGVDVFINAAIREVTPLQLEEWPCQRVHVLHADEQSRLISDQRITISDLKWKVEKLQDEAKLAPDRGYVQDLEDELASVKGDKLTEWVLNDLSNMVFPVIVTAVKTPWWVKRINKLVAIKTIRQVYRCGLREALEYHDECVLPETAITTEDAYLLSVELAKKGVRCTFEEVVPV